MKLLTLWKSKHLAALGKEAFLKTPSPKHDSPGAGAVAVADDVLLVAVGPWEVSRNCIVAKYSIRLVKPPGDCT
jgi:hypothetical protein